MTIDDPISRTSPGASRAPRPVTVYLVDDHEVVRRGVRELFAAHDDLQVIGESGSAAQASRRIPALRPDVALVDMRLTDGSGVEVCRAVRSVDPSIKVLVLTSYDDEEALFSAIMAGASGYLLKEVGSADLVDAVRRVAAGQSLLDPAVTERVLRRIREAPPVTAPGGGSGGLSDQEGRILAGIAEGLTNREIADQLHLAEKTVKNYVSSILAKLGLERRTQAAVYEVGRRLADPT